MSELFNWFVDLTREHFAAAGVHTSANSGMDAVGNGGGDSATSPLQVSGLSTIPVLGAQCETGAAKKPLQFSETSAASVIDIEMARVQRVMDAHAKKVISIKKENYGNEWQERTNTCREADFPQDTLNQEPPQANSGSQGRGCGENRQSPIPHKDGRNAKDGAGAWQGVMDAHNYAGSGLSKARFDAEVSLGIERMRAEEEEEA